MLASSEKRWFAAFEPIRRHLGRSYINIHVLQTIQKRSLNWKKTYWIYQVYRNIDPPCPKKSAIPRKLQICLVMCPPLVEKALLVAPQCWRTSYVPAWNTRESLVSRPKLVQYVLLVALQCWSSSCQSPLHAKPSALKAQRRGAVWPQHYICLLYTSDAADE